MELKEYSELTLSDDFLFGHVMKDSNLCKRLLEIILGVKIRKIEYIETQETMKVSIGSRGVRLDVYVADDQNTVYNIEMQTTNPKNLPKRTRYYQSIIDMNSLQKGTNYNELNNCYIIFICASDIFNKDRYVYTFQNLCKEEAGLKLGDGTVKIFLNYGGHKGDISPELASFLRYLKTGEVLDEYTQDLDNAVSVAKSNTEWEEEYMKYKADMLDQFNDGRAQGRSEGDKFATIRDIMSVMKELDCSLEKAMNVLKVPTEKRTDYTNIINKKMAKG